MSCVVCVSSRNEFLFCPVPQQTIRDLFDMNDGEKREVAVELSVPPTEEEETVNKQSTTILEQVDHKIMLNLLLCSYNNCQKKVWSPHSGLIPVGSLSC